MRRFAVLVTIATGLAIQPVTSGASSPARAPRAEGRTLIAVFAHPDDETIVAPLLARYAREGVKVVLAIATDGRKGVREHAGIAAGEALATARAAEARCACEKLGIEPPVLIGLEDGAMQAGENGAALREALERLFADLRPDAVVTWGPDGVSGHTDHRLVSAIVTEVVQSQAEAGPHQLYYAGLPAEPLARLVEQAGSSGPGLPMRPRTVRSRYLPVRIAYAPEDAAAATRSLDCHASQYTTEERQRLGGMARAVEDGTVYLRPWFVDPGRITELFVPAR
jgi:LmbE family N-acetylglucosaminyl deacetylase